MDLKTLKRIDRTLGHIFIFALRPFALLLGKLFRRDHRLSVVRHIVVLKILGGGSLIIALPALLALRWKFPNARMSLVCSAGVKAYANLMPLFDDVIVIETNGVLQVARSGLRAICRTFGADCIIDLEVHSKLSTVFCLLTCARNRVGYYMEVNHWRLGLGTHFLFLNRSSPMATAYAQAARAFEAEIDIKKSVEWFRSKNEIAWERPPLSGESVLALAPYCSDLGREREFTAIEWAQVLREKIGTNPTSLILLGDPSRSKEATKLEEVIEERLANCKVLNLVGKTSLQEVVGILRSVDELITIDSGVNHIARLISSEVTSYWGPTDPTTRLLEIPGLNEKVIYKKIFCSPCVHHIDFAPCMGNNICMKQHLELVDISEHDKQGWSIDRDTPLL